MVDIIRQLGPLAFASRLKRLSERLMRDVSKIYADLDVDFQARWFPVLYLLGQTQPLAVTEIAQHLNMTHPAINQIAAGMSKAGLLVSSRDRKDERRRMLSLSLSGRRTHGLLAPVWQEIRQATAKLIDRTEPDILGALDKIEQSLDELDMYERVAARLRKRQCRDLEIVEYSPKYKRHFKTLNLEWLEKSFGVEDQDKKILSDPYGQIIRKGGRIFFARQGGELIGTVALVRHERRIFELAKMSVTAKARGRQVGRRLAEYAIEKARESGAILVIVCTNPELTAANRLYEKLGFSKSKISPPTAYKRPTITMSLCFQTEGSRGKVVIEEP